MTSNATIDQLDDIYSQAVAHWEQEATQWAETDPVNGDAWMDLCGDYLLRALGLAQSREVGRIGLFYAAREKATKLRVHWERQRKLALRGLEFTVKHDLICL